MRFMQTMGNIQINNIADYIKVWILRALEPLGGKQEYINERGFSNDILGQVLKLDQVDSCRGENFDEQKARRQIREVYLKYENDIETQIPEGVFKKNIERLANLAGLNDVEAMILAFSVQLQCEQLLEDATDYLGELSISKVTFVLAVMLDIPESEVKRALSKKATLAQTGLLSLENSGKRYLRNKLELLSDGFAELVTSVDDDPVALLRETVKRGGSVELELDDYEYINESMAILLPYLHKACERKRKGVNILFYGQPGTGKTQLARTLSGVVQRDLFEVSSENDDGDTIDGEDRLKSYRAAQSFLKHRNALILFDEVEDIFGSGGGFMIPGFGEVSQKSSLLASKAWLNNMLENNEVPALWVSNSIRCIDPAYMRRFDMVVEVPVPPKKIREKLISQSCGELLSEQATNKLSCEENLSPAVIKRAASVVSYIKEDLPDSAGKSIEHIVESTLRAQGYIESLSGESDLLPEYFDISYIHTRVDLEQVAVGLDRNKGGRLCLYGPPGTGKTAYARWLADRLGIPLVLKRASDLLSCFIGETEKNMAKAFRDASRDGAVLLIDEVDSFLQDRRNASHSWEVAQVNEFLTQMEAFGGIFIASTNLVDNLDQAALRRFDLKAKFDYMHHEQAWRMFEKHCELLGLEVDSWEYRADIANMNVLTPGDFAAVMRQNRFKPIESAEQLYSALRDECAIKGQPVSSVGFLAGRA